MTEIVAAFQLYSRPSASEVTYRPVAVPRLVSWLLGRLGVALCRPRPADGVEIVEYTINSASLIRIVGSQIDLARRSDVVPTKVIIGRRQRDMLLGSPLDERFHQVRIPPGVPLLAGLELVVNPLIDGVVVG